MIRVGIICCLLVGVYAEDCRLLRVPRGDNVYKRLISLDTVQNLKSGDELFRYQFKYDVSNRDYLFHLYMTNATDLYEMSRPNAKHWAALFSDGPTKNVGYATLGDQSFNTLDSYEDPIKTYEEKKVIIDLVLTKDGTLNIEQPGKKKPILSGGEKKFPFFRYLAFEVNKADLSFYYNCKV